ncbi:hypothetical protein CEXT_194201 [Caerostris extrusa]|uniref:Uncharacterized protein n=1 Tax=Caerostris extrusa TaxID=172846 RepID=A0AAV4MKV4_CAEEX|nr:hypothetical protein CEXT_194201 [Caerostris extrusa]
MFRCSGIFGFTCSKKDRGWIKTFKILLVVLNVAIALYQLSAVVSLLKQNKANGNIPLTIVNLMVFANRCILTVKMEELENIINRLSKFRSNRLKSTTRLLSVTVAVLFFIQVFIVCYKLASFGYIYPAKDILFQLNIETPIIEKIIGYCFEISMFLFGVLPNTAFCVFYSSLYVNISERLHYFIHFANDLTLFIAMTCSASSVAEASMRVDRYLGNCRLLKESRSFFNKIPFFLERRVILNRVENCSHQQKFYFRHTRSHSHLHYVI